MEYTNECEFIPILGFETYKLNKLGEVLSPNGGTLKHIPKNGYASVWLYKAGKRVQVYVHKLMEAMFFSEKSDVVNHIDGDKMNPILSNLEPSTESGNLKHAYDTGLREAANTATCTLVSPDGELVTVTNISKFCREHKLTRSCICYVLSGKNKQHKGWMLP